MSQSKMFRLTSKLILDNIEEINLGIPAVNGNNFMFRNKVDLMFRDVIEFVENKKKEHKQSPKLTSAEIMCIVHSCNAYFLKFVNKKTDFTTTDDKDNENLIFIGVDDYFNIFIKRFLPGLKKNIKIYDHLRLMLYLDTQFPISHDLLYTYGVITKQIRSESTQIEDIRNVSALFEKKNKDKELIYKHGVDYIKISKGKEYDFKPNIDYLPVETERKTTFYMTGSAFKKILMRCQNTDVYCDYFLLLEYVFEAYRNYSVQVKAKIIECGKIQFGQLMQNSEEELKTLKKNYDALVDINENLDKDNEKLLNRNIDLEYDNEALKEIEDNYYGLQSDYKALEIEAVGYKNDAIEYEAKYDYVTKDYEEFKEVFGNDNDELRDQIQEIELERDRFKDESGVTDMLLSERFYEQKYNQLNEKYEELKREKSVDYSQYVHISEYNEVVDSINELEYKMFKSQNNVDSLKAMLQECKDQMNKITSNNV